MRTNEFQIHPLSIVILFSFIFFATHLQLQRRQDSYRISEKIKELRAQKDIKTQLEFEKNQLQRPKHVQKVAEKMTLRKASFEQVIIMSPNKGNL